MAVIQPANAEHQQALALRDTTVMRDTAFGGDSEDAPLPVGFDRVLLGMSTAGHRAPLLADTAAVWEQHWVMGEGVKEFAGRCST